MKIVVTGGAGFIGANLCHELQSRPGVSKGLSLTWPVIGNEGVWNTVGVPPSAGQPFGPGNEMVERRLNWWYDASQAPDKV